MILFYFSLDTVHEGKRKFSCEFCGTTFAHKEGMLCHIRSVHEGIRYQCELCSKSFTQKPHLKSHMSEAHSVKPSFTKYV